MQVFNSLTKKKEEIVSLEPHKIGLYTCGITAYDFAQIGNERKYVQDDLLRRTLEYIGYEVKHVQNVTDVGHLVSDSDDGEDKLEKGARKDGKTVWEIAEFYTKYFYDSLNKLNVLKPTVVCKATDNIPEQIALVKTLLEKGHAYETSTGIFFSIESFPAYGHLFGQNLLDKKVGAREDVIIDKEKKNPADFALWFKAIGRFENHTMQWDSPWGKGFPGWHIECSAMSMKYLGETFDIHTGGIDHLAVHHPNEIAQSEAATGKKFVNYWIHTHFLMVAGTKMSKSLNNFYKIDDIEAKGYLPLSLRYFYMQTHYRREINFTWEALAASDSALRKLKNLMSKFKEEVDRTTLSEEKLEKVNIYREQFKKAIEDDLNMPEALAIVWEVAKSNIPNVDKYDLLIEFDSVLGLQLKEKDIQIHIPKEIISLANERLEARNNNDFEKADELRKLLAEKGYIIKDTTTSYTLQKI